jgi:hypothetical protein
MGEMDRGEGIPGGNKKTDNFEEDVNDLFQGTLLGSESR